jgi:hypothetical protein
VKVEKQLEVNDHLMLNEKQEALVPESFVARVLDGQFER